MFILGIILALKRLSKIFSLLNLLTFISLITASTAITANPKANSSRINQISQADQRAADEYRQLGLSYRKQERFDDAIAALQQSVKLDPQNIDGLIILGWTQHLAKKHDAAATSLWEAIYRSPTSLQAFNAIGIVYLVRGDLPQSVALHSSCLLYTSDAADE